MHTLAKNAHHNDRLIKFCLEKAYPDGIITVDRLISDNLVNGTQVAELAVCRTNGVKLCSVGIGRDLEDDSDVKTVTVQENTKKTWLIKDKCKTGKFNTSTSHRAQVKDIVNKIGKLRVICYNPFFDIWSYYVIPYEVHCRLKKLTLTFDKDTGEVVGKYKQFETSSWEEMCCQ